MDIKKFVKEGVHNSLRSNNMPEKSAPQIDPKHLQNESGDDEVQDTDTVSGDKKGRYEKIQQLLANEIFNTAEICNRLWGSKDATKRSLFKKKLDQATNDTGDVYEFDDEELAKISGILRDTSRSITKTVGRKGS
jgi:tRNA G18 (ribose-2'-O)-methylase SpoU